MKIPGWESYCVVNVVRGFNWKQKGKQHILPIQIPLPQNLWAMLYIFNDTILFWLFIEYFLEIFMDELSEDWWIIIVSVDRAIHWWCSSNKLKMIILCINQKDDKSTSPIFHQNVKMYRSKPHSRVLWISEEIVRSDLVERKLSKCSERNHDECMKQKVGPQRLTWKIFNALLWFVWFSSSK